MTFFSAPKLPKLPSISEFLETARTLTEAQLDAQVGLLHDSISEFRGMGLTHAADHCEELAALIEH